MTANTSRQGPGRDRAYTSDELAALSDEEQFLLQHQLTYGPGLTLGAWPDDAVLPVGSHTPAHWVHHRVADAAGQWATVQGLRGRRGVYRVITPMTGLGDGQKGTARQATLAPGIFFDLDTLDGVHEPSRTGLPDPTREQAREIMAVLCGHGVKLTYVADTGGGYQAAIITDQPVPAGSPLPAKAAEALKAVSASLGVACDVKLTKGAAYPMRVAGGRNRKTKPAELTPKMVKSGWTTERLDQIPDDIADRPVRLAAVTGETMTAEALETALDAVTAACDPVKSGKPGPPPGPDDGEQAGYRHSCGATRDPRDQVCLELPMSRVLRELSRFDFTQDIPDGPLSEPVRLTWADDPDRGTSAELGWGANPDGGRERSYVVGYGGATCDLLGTEEQKPTCTFWYIRNVHCGGDTLLAYALISHFTGGRDGEREENR